MTVRYTSLRASAELDASKYEAGARRKVAADEKMTQSGKEVGAGVGATERQVVASAGGFTRYGAAVDKAYAAQLNFDKAQRALNRALDTGKISAETHAAWMEKHRQKLAAATSASNDNAGAMTKHDAAMRRAAGSVGVLDRALGALPAQFAALSLAMGPIGIVIVAIHQMVQAVRDFVLAGDKMVQVIGRLNAATGSMRAAVAVYDDLYRIARQTGTSVEDSAGQFVRFSIAARQIGATRDEVVQLVETVQKFGIVSGASTQEAAAGATQLGQALASGRLQGDELRSILENMPLLAEALAKQLGVSIGQLREMGAAGELTADKVFGALLRAADDANEAFDKLPLTVERAAGRMWTAFGRFNAQIDEGLGLSRSLAEVLDAIADKLDSVTASMSDAPAAVAGRLRKEREALAAELEALGNEADIFRADPSKMLAPGMSGTRIADTEAQIKATQQRREELSRLIAALDHQIFREAEVASMQALGEMETADRAKAEAELAASKAALGKVMDELATKEEQAKKDLAERMAVLEDAKSNGLLDEATYVREAAKAQAEYAEALQKATGRKREAIDTEAEFASALFEAVQKLDEYEGAASQATAALEHDNEILRLQIEGRDEEAAWLETEIQLRERLGPVYEKNAEQIKALWEERRRLTETLRGEQQQARDVAAAWKRHFEQIDRVAEDIAGDWAESIYNGLTGNGDDILSWFKSLFKRIAIEALKAQVILPIATQVVGAVPGLFGIKTPSGTAATGGAGGMGVGIGDLSSIGNLFSGSSSLYNIGSSI
ncbi:MAG: tape measure protein, partial [Caenispirillum sp.]|nr:tape measure protein [Caenispirillum sp.]